MIWLLLIYSIRQWTRIEKLMQPYCYCVGENMCFNPFTINDENEARHDNGDEGDSTEEEGS